MNRKGFINIIIIILVAVVTGAGIYFSLNRKTVPSIPPIACTQEAKQCPDGSYVGRTGPNCEFAKCPEIIDPSPVTECKKDSDCPSPQYVCRELQGVGTACPSGDSSCMPTYTVTKGECKLKEGNRCSTDSDCSVGLCHDNVCVSPITRQCSGPNDASCPSDYECVQGCGSPVGYPDEPPPSYFCQLQGYIRTCPICLSVDTLIDTPSGAIPIQQLQKGSPVWTTNKSGDRVSGVVVSTGKTDVSINHQMVRLTFDDGRVLLVSPGHPTADGRTAGEILANDFYDGARVVTSDLVDYGYTATYDILPSGPTGFYWANGILLDSTLH